MFAYKSWIGDLILTHLKNIFFSQVGITNQKLNFRVFSKYQIYFFMSKLFKFYQFKVIGTKSMQNNSQDHPATSAQIH